MKAEETGNIQRSERQDGTLSTEKRRHRHEKGDAPVIAVVLLVAITVILAAVVGTFGLALVSENPQTASAGVTVEDGEVKLIATGNVDEVRVEVDGFEIGSMTDAGEAVPIAVPGKVTVNVIGVIDGKETVLRSKVVEDAGEAGVTSSLVNEGEGTDGFPFEAEEPEVWKVRVVVKDAPEFSLAYCVDDDVADGDLDGSRCTEESLDDISPPIDTFEIENEVLNRNNGDLVHIDTFELRDDGGNVIDEVTASDTFVDDGRTTVNLKPE
ncbi:MAG: type IV pilin [Halobacteriales archaeon]|nr:type IV pilin [Halobacteriales archaeon]